MGRKTHGVPLLHAIEVNDHHKVHDILAVQVGNKAKVRAMCTSEVKRFPNSEYTECPLMVACKLEDPTLVKYMVTKHEVNVNFVHKQVASGKVKMATPLLMAVRYGMYDTVETILALNADSNIQDHNGRAALHHAVRKANYRMAKMLLARGAKANVNDNNGNSPLLIASKFGHVELVKLLLQYGADLYKAGPHGAIPIHIAAREGHIGLLRLLVFQDVNINIKIPCYGGMREKTPLHVACEQGHVEAVLNMIEQFGADINMADSEGETPLHCTVVSEYDQYGMKSKDDFTETAKVLLRYGAEVNVQNMRGETALHLAARNEFQRIVELLIQAGIDPQIKDNDNNKAIDLVTAEDAVTKNFLKRASEDREKLVSELLEMKARGFSTSLRGQGNLLSSQSTMNMSMRSNSMMSRAASTPGLFQPSNRNSIISIGACSIAPIYEDGYLQPMEARQMPNGLALGGQGNRVLPRPPGRSSSISSAHSLQSLQSSTYAQIEDTVFLKEAGKAKKLRKNSELHRSRESQLAIDAASDSSVCEEPRYPFQGKRSMSVEQLLRKHAGRQTGSDNDAESLALSSIVSESLPAWQVSPKSALGKKEVSPKSETSPKSNSSFGSQPVPLSPAAKRKLLADSLREESASVRSESTVVSDSTLIEDNQPQMTIHITTPKAKRATAAKAPTTPTMSSFTPLSKKKPSPEAPGAPGQKGAVSDSDDTFFDDESFDSMSETSETSPGKNQAELFVKGNRSTVLVEPNGSIVKSPEKPPQKEVAVKKAENPKLEKWLVEQAEIAKVREKNVKHPATAKPAIPMKPKKDELMDNLPSDSDESLNKHIKAPMLTPKSKLAAKDKPIPAARVDSPKKLNVTPSKVHPKDGEKPPISAKPALPPRRTSSSASDSTINKPPPPPPPSDSEPKSQDTIIMNNLNTPGTKTLTKVEKPKIKPVTENNKVQGLHWERVEQEDADDSLYWEHTSTEKIYEGMKERSFDHGDGTDKEVQRFVDPRMAPKAEVEDLTDAASSVGRSPSVTSEEEEEFEIPNSCHMIAFWYDPKYTRSRTENIVISPRQSRLSSSEDSKRHSSTNSRFVPVPGALELAESREVTNEYKRYKDMGQVNVSSPRDIKNTVEKRMSYSEPESPHPKDMKKVNEAPKVAASPVKRVEIENVKGGEAVEYTMVKKVPAKPQSDPRGKASLSLVINQIPPPAVPAKSPEIKQEAVQIPKPPEVKQVVQQQLPADDDDNESHGTLDTFDSFDETDAELDANTSNQKEQDRSATQPQSGQDESMHDENQNSPNKRVTIGGEEFFADQGRPKDFENREVSYNTEGKLRFTLVGGNSDGIYIHKIDQGSDAEKQGLLQGDQLLKINGQSVLGKTKEETTLMLMSLQQRATLLVRFKKERYQRIVSNGGMGDSFFVKALFVFRSKEKTEMDLAIGDILSIRETMPDGKMGSWMALKMNAKSGEKQHGLIPNQRRAEQLILAEQMKRSLSIEKEERGGFLRRSLRRSKSADRLNKKDKDNQPATLPLSKDIKTYERVEQKPPSFIRPIVLLGLFCNTVCNRLAQDSPGRFDLPSTDVELKTPDPKETRVDHNPIRECIQKNRHCLMMVSPRAIEQLHEAQFQPIVIYMSPGNKLVLKAIRNQLAPAYKARTAFMLEEANSFHKQFSHLFTATVTYTTDGSWLPLLRDTIGRIQNQPIWVKAQPKTQEDLDELYTNLPEPSPTRTSRPRLRSLPRDDPSSGLQRALIRHGSASATNAEAAEPPQGPNSKLNLTYDGYFLVDSQKGTNGQEDGSRGNPSPVSSTGSQGPRSILKKKNGNGENHYGNMPTMDHVITQDQGQGQAQVNQYANTARMQAQHQRQAYQNRPMPQSQMVQQPRVNANPHQYAHRPETTL